MLMSRSFSPPNLLFFSDAPDDFADSYPPDDDDSVPDDSDLVQDDLAQDDFVRNVSDFPEDLVQNLVHSDLVDISGLAEFDTSLLPAWRDDKPSEECSPHSCSTRAPSTESIPSPVTILPSPPAFLGLPLSPLKCLAPTGATRDRTGDARNVDFRDGRDGEIRDVDVRNESPSQCPPPLCLGLAHSEPPASSSLQSQSLQSQSLQSQSLQKVLQNSHAQRTKQNSEVKQNEDVKLAVSSSMPPMPSATPSGMPERMTKTEGNNSKTDRVESNEHEYNAQTNYLFECWLVTLSNDVLTQQLLALRADNRNFSEQLEHLKEKIDKPKLTEPPPIPPVIKTEPSVPGIISFSTPASPSEPLWNQTPDPYTESFGSVSAGMPVEVPARHTECPQKTEYPKSEYPKSEYPESDYPGKVEYPQKAEYPKTEPVPITSSVPVEQQWINTAAQKPREPTRVQRELTFTRFAPLQGAPRSSDANAAYHYGSHGQATEETWRPMDLKCEEPQTDGWSNSGQGYEAEAPTPDIWGQGYSQGEEMAWPDSSKYVHEQHEYGSMSAGSSVGNYQYIDEYPHATGRQPRIGPSRFRRSKTSTWRATASLQSQPSSSFPNSWNADSKSLPGYSELPVAMPAPSKHPEWSTQAASRPSSSSQSMRHQPNQTSFQQAQPAWHPSDSTPSHSTHSAHSAHSAHSGHSGHSGHSDVQLRLGDVPQESKWDSNEYSELLQNSLQNSYNQADSIYPGLDYLADESRTLPQSSSNHHSSGSRHRSERRRHRKRRRTSYRGYQHDEQRTSPRHSRRGLEWQAETPKYSEQFHQYAPASEQPALFDPTFSSCLDGGEQRWGDDLHNNSIDLNWQSSFGS